MGGWTLAPRKNFEKRDCKRDDEKPLGIKRNIRIPSKDCLRSTHVILPIGIAIRRTIRWDFLFFFFPFIVAKMKKEKEKRKIEEMMPPEREQFLK